MAAVRYYLSGFGGQESTASKFDDGLTKANRYTGAFKLDVVRTTPEEELTHRQAAARFNIPASTSVALWIKLFQEQGPEALYTENRGRQHNVPEQLSEKPSDPNARPSAEEMEEELRFLRAQVDL